MRRLDDAGKSLSTKEDISVRTAVVDREPQRSEKTEQFAEQMSHHRICRYQLSNEWSTLRHYGDRSTLKSSEVARINESLTTSALPTTEIVEFTLTP
ncbi:hypothetical protein TNCV_4422911 [Trichonephila clavipes]|nr:hypothetical protein TNCV_4422911 [Trichonephila clavipes]